jgi:hypothetical protein
MIRYTDRFVNRRAAIELSVGRSWRGRDLAQRAKRLGVPVRAMDERGRTVASDPRRKRDQTSTRSLIDIWRSLFAADTYESVTEPDASARELASKSEPRGGMIAEGIGFLNIAP